MTELRGRGYDPLTAIRESMRELAGRVAAIEQQRQVAHLKRRERQRYAKLRRFRARAIERLAAGGKLTYEEIGAAFDLSKQRIEQIVRRWPGGRRAKGERSVPETELPNDTPARSLAVDPPVQRHARPSTRGKDSSS